MIFVLDENLSKYVARALSVLQDRLNARRGTDHEVYALVDFLEAGIKDPELFNRMPDDGVLITYNIGQQRTWDERLAIKEEELNTIYFRYKSNLTYWQMVLFMINAWEDILLKSASLPQPFLIRYKPKDVRYFARIK